MHQELGEGTARTAQQAQIGQKDVMLNHKTVWERVAAAQGVTGYWSAHHTLQSRWHFLKSLGYILQSGVVHHFLYAFVIIVFPSFFLS